MRGVGYGRLLEVLDLLSLLLGLASVGAEVLFVAARTVPRLVVLFWHPLPAPSSPVAPVVGLACCALALLLERL